MNQCAWCYAVTSKNFKRARIDQSVTICHSCYRSKRNGFVACALCHQRRQCDLLSSNNKYYCSKCMPSPAPVLSCVKCGTTKSMNWHTNFNEQSTCLYCYEEQEEESPHSVTWEEEEEEEGMQVDVLKHVVNSESINEEEDEEEMAVHLLYNMIVSLSNKCTVY